MDQQTFRMMKVMAEQLVEINRTCRFFKTLVILLLLLQAVAATVMVAAWLAQSRL